MTTEAAVQEEVLPLCEIDGLDAYLRNYGSILGHKAIHALNPLHVPGRDPLPDFSWVPEDRQPFPCQAHATAAITKMLDEAGSGFLAAEMGCGKTIMAILAIHNRESRSRRKGGSNGKYRALVLCPDHLLDVWRDEILSTIPDAKVTIFGPMDDDDDDDELPGKRKKGKSKRDPKSKETLRDTLKLLDLKAGNRWKKPEGPEWYIMGRNRAKRMPAWKGIADPYRGINGHMTDQAVSSKHVIVKQEPILDEYGRQVRGWDHKPLMANQTARAYYCPKCGTVALNDKGLIQSSKGLSGGVKDTSQKTCKGTYLQMVSTGDKANGSGLDRICPVPPEIHGRRRAPGGQPFSHAGKTWVVKSCGEPLYSYAPKSYAWAPAKVIQKKCRGLFRHLVIDEVHEQKSDSSAQSMAAGKLMAATNHTLALTGTIIGGYATHLYPLMMRMTPQSLREEGFEWGKSMSFAEIYGRIDTVTTVTEKGGEGGEKDGGSGASGNSRSMRKAKSGERNVARYVRPGVMPTMFGAHMLGSSIFVTLGELADELPDLFEYVGGPMPETPRLEQFESDDNFTADEKYADALEHHSRMEAGWFDTAISMEPEQHAEYNRIRSTLEYANKQLLQTGSMKLLGAYLWTCLDYPDRPFGWGHDPEVMKAYNAALAEIEELRLRGDVVPNAPKLGHTIGYWREPRNRHIENFIGVVTPKDCPEGRVYPKEQALIDICKKQKADGRQSWVYVNMTGTRDIQVRLKKLLESEGLTVKILRANDVQPENRGAWIKAQGKAVDVVISNPQLVSTGMTLFSKEEGGHNYSTLIFYETGYNLFTLVQASRRAWRIGQPRDCRVYYLYYKDTMQHKGVALMSKKKAALDSINGDFSEDGLAAMAGEDNLQMSLAKNLSEKIDSADMQRSWSKVRSSPKKPQKVTRPGDAIATIAAPPRRVSWAMPRTQDLIDMTDAMRSAFLKIAGSPDLDWNRDTLEYSYQTWARLDKMGLVTRGEHTVRCKLSGGPLEATLAWLKLYPSWTGLYMPLGIVSASHPERGEHYVQVVMNGEAPVGLSLHPAHSFPGCKALMLSMDVPELSTHWTLTSATPEDEAALKAAGFFASHKASPLDKTPISFQMVAESLIEHQSDPVPVFPRLSEEDESADPEVDELMADPEWADYFAAQSAQQAVDPCEGEPEVADDDEGEEAVVDDFDSEPVELSPEFLAEMYAHMIATGEWGKTG